MSHECQFRLASRSDLHTLVTMLADDPLGAQRERVSDPVAQCYHEAFDRIDRDPNNQIILATIDDAIVGFLQLTVIPNLTYQGGSRGLIEGVRVGSSHRGQGIGRALMEEAIERASDAGCRLVQLTTDAQRPETLRFYEGLGFKASHVGCKLDLAAC